MVPPLGSDSAAGRRDRTAHRLARLASEWDAVRASTAPSGEHDRAPAPELASAAPDTHTRVAAARRHADSAGSAARREEATSDPAPDDARPTPAIRDRAAAVEQGGAVRVPVPGRHARRRPGLSRLLPGSWPGRVDLGSAHLTVVALLVAAGLAVTSWWVLRSEEEQLAEPLPAAALATPSEQATAGQGTAGQGPAGQGEASAGATEPSAGAVAAVLVVDVAGKVRRPGLVELPEGSRVADAIKAAGGSRPGVSMAGVNLARPLVDGEQILIGADQQPAPAGSPASSTSAAPTLVNLNTADATALEALPQVGPVTAAAIVAWRTEHGSFTAVEELLEVDGIGDATLAQIAPHVTL